MNARGVKHGGEGFQLGFRHNQDSLAGRQHPRGKIRFLDGVERAPVQVKIQTGFTIAAGRDGNRGGGLILDNRGQLGGELVAFDRGE